MNEQLALLPAYLTAHLQLTLLALAASAAVSLPLGIAATRVRWLEQPALAIAAVIQTIPSLALLAVMVPILATLQLQSIGFLPAFIGLSLYGMLPMLRNTVTGIAGVDPTLKEAARGVGMTPAQQLRQVELPLAMPIIVAGLRTATVWTVGMATLSTPVGATSLGNYIFTGLQTRNFSAVLVGCVASAVLALLLDALVHSLEVGVRDRRPRLVAVAGAVTAALYLYTVGSLAGSLVSEGDRPISVGAKGFTEQYVLAELLTQWIEQETDQPTAQRQSLGSIVAFDALAAGDVDVYVDYSGTVWANVMGQTGTGSRAEVRSAVAQYLDETHGIQIAATLGFENAYSLAMRDEDADRLGIARISDLPPLGLTLSMGGDLEFFSRPEWTAIEEVYGLRLAEERTMDAGLMYQAAAEGAVDLISAYTTDGRITAYDLRVLDDDRGAIPPYDALVMVSGRLVEERPDVVEALGRLDGRIDVEAMRQMNLAVDEGGENPASVATEFLRSLAR